MSAYDYFKVENMPLSIARFNALFDKDCGMYSPILEFESKVEAIEESVLLELGPDSESRQKKLLELIDKWLVTGLSETDPEKVRIAMDVYSGQFCGFIKLVAVLFFAKNMDDIVGMLESMKEWANYELANKLDEVTPIVYDMDEPAFWEAFDNLIEGKETTWEEEMKPVPEITLTNKRSKK
jgi:hypothetical protein